MERLRDEGEFRAGSGEWLPTTCEASLAKLQELAERFPDFEFEIRPASQERFPEPVMLIFVRKKTDGASPSV